MRDNVVHLHSKPRVTIMPVLEEDFDAFLDIGMRLIAPAIKRQSKNITLSDIEGDIRGGNSVMWLIYVEDTLTAALTTSVIRHPQRNTLRIEFMGGTRMREWMSDAMKTFSDLAKKANLGAIEADGRIGFDKSVDASPFKAL